MREIGHVVRALHDVAVLPRIGDYSGREARFGLTVFQRGEVEVADGLRGDFSVAPIVKSRFDRIAGAPKAIGQHDHEPNMLLIGVDYHPSFQQVAFLNQDTCECSELHLHHSNREVERFYRDLQQRGIRVRVGMEATGFPRWFERLLAELGFEVWIGDPAEIRAKRVKKRKTDRKDALLLLWLMREDNFPRIWVSSPENRDLRQLLWHRHQLVQVRTRIMNQLQVLAINEGKRWKTKLWNKPRRVELEKLALASWPNRRRKEFLE